MENGRKAMEEELIKGRDIANELLEVFVHKSNAHNGEVKGSMLRFVEDLVREVLCSFTNTLLILNTNSDVSNELVMPTTIKHEPSSVKCPKIQDTDEPCKISFFRSKNRRGCYKRKSSIPIWERNSSILMEDGYVWRKYGQKVTMNAKYLRSYYRCTHKYDEGCPAIKQVQRIQEDPPLYRTTYYGHHICKTSLITSEIMLEPASDSCNSSTFLNFSNSFPSKNYQYPFSSSISSSTEKEVVSDEYIVHNQLPSSDHLLLGDNEPDFDYSRHVTKLLSAESVQFDDVGNLNFGC